MCVCVCVCARARACVRAKARSLVLTTIPAMPAVLARGCKIGAIFTNASRERVSVLPSNSCATSINSKNCGVFVCVSVCVCVCVCVRACVLVFACMCELTTPGHSRNRSGTSLTARCMMYSSKPMGRAVHESTGLDAR